MKHPLVTDYSEFITWSGSGFWKALITVLGAIVVLVGIVNLTVDPLELYGTDLFLPWQFNRYERKLELFRKFNPPA